MASFTINREEVNKLIDKYGGSVPRYTSYPTAPEWQNEFSNEEMQKTYETAIQKSNYFKKPYSLYLHIPFCESQCYYCGCNVVISPKHGIEKQYLDQLKEEISYYGDLVHKDRVAAQMAWGGGTPTYLSPEQIIDLYDHIAKNFNLISKEKSNLKSLAEKSKSLEENIDKLSLEKEYAIEIDPRVTSKEHLEALWQCGFNRLSMGIQDFNPQTQESINRIQSFESVSKIVEEARHIGFKSINFDLIYGLPHQTLDTFKDTIQKVKEIDPERIALFNYAHIPEIFPYQKKYITDDILPSQEVKLAIFDNAVEELTGFGYHFIGLDHFAKADDMLSIAQKEKTLYRNFQGYTTHSGCDLFSFGISAISDVQGVYKQNVKKMKDYYADILTADKFMKSSNDDMNRREIIKEIMCNGRAFVDIDKYAIELKALEPYFNDHLLNWVADYSNNNVKKSDDTWAHEQIQKANALIENKKILLELTDKGRFFVRNIASVFDTYLNSEKGHKIFSKSL